MKKIESLKSMTVPNDEEIIKLRTSSDTIEVERSIMTRVYNSKLAELVKSEFRLPKDSDGAIKVNIDTPLLY